VLVHTPLDQLQQQVAISLSSCPYHRWNCSLLLIQSSRKGGTHGTNILQVDPLPDELIRSISKWGQWTHSTQRPRQHSIGTIANVDGLVIELRPASNQPVVPLHLKQSEVERIAQFGTLRLITQFEEEFVDLSSNLLEVCGKAQPVGNLRINYIKSSLIANQKSI